MSIVRTPSWHDAQYDARAAIPEQAEIRAAWRERSAHTRASVRCRLDLPYGDHPSERLDVFGPAPAHAGRPAPVLVYIHGGYWRALDKQDQSFVAGPFAEAGAVVVLPNYALAPTVTVRHIVLQMVRAVAWVHRHIASFDGDPARLVVAGHSAGGHLAAMMLVCRWAEVGPDLPPQVVSAVLALSGVFDLAPLRRAPFLARDLALTAAEARALSPCNLPAPTRGRLLAVVGGDESAEFHRQTRLIRRLWGPAAVPVCETVPGRHHMNVLQTLAEPESWVHRLALQLLGIDGRP